jgi:hypothetical protein
MECALKKIFLLLCFFIFLLNQFIFTSVIIRTKKIAKIGDEIILENDIKKYSSLYSIDYDEAKKILIDSAILYTGAKIFTDAPMEEDVDEQLRKDKAYYASLVGKEVRDVTDEEFLENLNNNIYSLTSYRNELRKKLWIQKYLTMKLEEKQLEIYKPSDKEIMNLIKNNPSLFEEQEGALLSMIYFSYFDNKNGRVLNKKQIEELKKNAELCLSELKRNERYSDMVEKYSDDLISKNNTPKGRVGFIAFDDTRVISKFSQEIINDLQEADKGIIYKVYNTRNGLFIFKIDEKIQPKRLNEDQVIIKAESYLEKEHEKKIKDNLKKDLIEKLKNDIEIVFY